MVRQTMYSDRMKFDRKPLPILILHISSTTNSRKTVFDFVKSLKMTPGGVKVGIEKFNL